MVTQKERLNKVHGRLRKMVEELGCETVALRIRAELPGKRRLNSVMQSVSNYADNIPTRPQADMLDAIERVLLSSRPVRRRRKSVKPAPRNGDLKMAVVSSIRMAILNARAEDRVDADTRHRLSNRTLFPTFIDVSKMTDEEIVKALSQDILKKLKEKA